MKEHLSKYQLAASLPASAPRAHYEKGSQFAPQPATVHRMSSYGSSYSTETEEDDRNLHEADWFDVYTRNTNEKGVVAEGIVSIIQNTYPKRKTLKILDVGCGNGDLALKYLRQLIAQDFTIHYYGIEKEATYRERFSSRDFIAMGSRLTIEMSSLDCFDESLLKLNFSPDIVLCSHVGYFGNVKSLTENVLQLPGEPLALFIHQSPHSMVNKLRKDFGAKVLTTTNQQIIEQLQESGSTTREQKQHIFFHDIPSIVNIPSDYKDKIADPEWHRKEVHTSGHSQDTSDLCSFASQRTPKGIVKGRLLGDFTSNLAQLTHDGEILVWNRFILFSKSHELISKANSGSQNYFRKPGIYDRPTIQFALREANIGIIRHEASTKEGALEPNNVQFNPLIILLLAAYKQKDKPCGIADRYHVATKFVALHCQTKNILEASILAKDLKLTEFEYLGKLASRIKPPRFVSTQVDISTVYDFSRYSSKRFVSFLSNCFEYFKELFAHETTFAFEARQHALSMPDNRDAMLLFSKHFPDMVTPRVVKNPVEVHEANASNSQDDDILALMPLVEEGNAHKATDKNPRDRKKRRLVEPETDFAAASR